MRFKIGKSALAFVLALSFYQAPITLACGPFSLEAIFTFTVHPEFPLEKFARGEIGVGQPSYARSYLYVAYRYLAGETFNLAEQKALKSLWEDRLDHRSPSNDQELVEPWLSARQRVSGVSAAPKIEVYRYREKPNEFESYLNCQKDAFENAATTLDSRIKQFGSAGPIISEWVAAQDQVFANCSAGKQIPAVAPSEADPIIRADRSYQLAAAHFYAGDFDEAARLFESISQDSNSPWHSVAPYLVARTLIRKASLGAAEGKREALAAAEKQLKTILRESHETRAKANAERLLNLVRVRLYPQTKIHELAMSLSEKNQNEELKQNLWDYTILLDDFLGDDTAEPKSEVPQELRNDDLTDWLVTFQSPKPEALLHSLEQWQARSSVPWLVSSLSKVDADNPKAVSLLAAGAKIGPDSPAFATVVFHSVRLEMLAGRGDSARSRLDELLRKERERLNVSSINLLLGERLSLSQNLTDLLTLVQRMPAAFSWNEDGRELPAEPSEVNEETKALLGKQFFDVDGAEILNGKLPLSLLKQAAASKVLPNHLRRDVAQAAWLRAVLLGDTATADELVPTMRSLIPETSDLLNAYLSSHAPKAKRFSAIYLWLKFPGLEPVVDTGAGRQTPLNEQDTYRDNWWCSAATVYADTGAQEQKPESQFLASIRHPAYPPFLSQSEKFASARETAALKSVGAGPNEICREVLEWATTNPDDPRVPEALHLAVRTTRYGCTDKQSGRWSKAAYDQLHKRYPDSLWTKRTPYWFKD